MFLKENDEIRKKSSEEMAVCHYHHLKEELNKSPELLANLTAEGITFEEHTKALIKELEDLFPEISSSKPLEVNESSPNLICDWWENFARTAGRDSYQDSSFKFINAIFMERIKYAKDPSEDAKERLLQSTIDNMIKTRLIERGLPISHLLRIMNDLSRVIERRFAAMGFAPLESYRSLIERLDNVQNSALFQYYFDLAQNALERSDKLLRNILPESIAETLKEEEAPAPIHYDSATVVFTDFVGFSRTAGDMVPVELVHKLDRCFKAYDSILDRYGLEKLKTIGDSYMFAGGIPEESKDHAEQCVRAALDIRDFMREEIKIHSDTWPVRIGVHTGPLVAGIVGIKKFSYDIWGDTVNIASRMESSGDPDSVNISEFTYSAVKDKFKCREIGVRSIKNRGEMMMYSVERLT